MADFNSEDCNPKRNKVDEDSSVTLFREYLRIETVQPHPNYGEAKKFLQRVAENIGLEFRCCGLPNKPTMVMSWKGTDPSLKSILLNSHVDVVPVFPENWKYSPFDAVKDEKGNIYARGAQDMKCVGIQYIEAIRRLKTGGKQFPRTIHLSFVPDEEIGGNDGMETFLKSPLYESLNIGFGLDEGLANPGEEITVFHGERSIWWVEFCCPGDPGHASMFIENTCAEKVKRLLDQILNFREAEKQRLESDKTLALGDVTTVNITKLQGGVQLNVVPSEYIVGADFRIDPHRNLEEFCKEIDDWVAKAGKDVTYKFAYRSDQGGITSVSPGDPWWDAFSGACKMMNVKLKTEIFPAGTDSRYLRAIGIPALGFSPMNFTPILLHDHNEFLNEDIFLKGIDIYCEIIPALANVR